MSNTGENTFDNASKLIENSLGFVRRFPVTLKKIPSKHPEVLIGDQGILYLTEHSIAIAIYVGALPQCLQRWSLSSFVAFHADPVNGDDIINLCFEGSTTEHVTLEMNGKSAVQEVTTLMHSVCGERPSSVTTDDKDSMETQRDSGGSSNPFDLRKIVQGRNALTPPILDSTQQQSADKRIGARKKGPPPPPKPKGGQNAVPTTGATKAKAKLPTLLIPKHNDENANWKEDAGAVPTNGRSPGRRPQPSPRMKLKEKSNTREEVPSVITSPWGEQCVHNCQPPLELPPPGYAPPPPVHVPPPPVSVLPRPMHIPDLRARAREGSDSSGKRPVLPPASESLMQYLEANIPRSSSDSNLSTRWPPFGSDMKKGDSCCTDSDSDGSQDYINVIPRVNSVDNIRDVELAQENLESITDHNRPLTRTNTRKVAREMQRRQSGRKLTKPRVTEENYPDPDVPTTFAPPSPAVEDKNKTSIDDFDIYSADENYDYWSKEISFTLVKIMKRRKPTPVTLNLPFKERTRLTARLLCTGKTIKDWRFLGSEIGLSYEELSIIEAFTSSMACRKTAPEIVLMHWQFMYNKYKEDKYLCPYPCNRKNLIDILEKIERYDLVDLLTEGTENA